MKKAIPKRSQGQRMHDAAKERIIWGYSLNGVSKILITTRRLSGPWSVLKLAPHKCQALAKFVPSYM
eukprot:scaffold12513_cov103-Skeletonema_dohrnii-CCMP3373.AAC.8